MSSLTQNMKGPVQELLTEVIIPGIPSPSKSEIIKIEPSDPLDITEHSKPITVQEPPPTKLKSKKNTTPHETSLDEQKKNSNCKICQSSKTCQRTLCAKCLDSYVSMIDEEYCCKLCDQKNIQKEIVIHHVDKDHFAPLFVNSTNSSEISDPKNVESPPEVNVTKENAKINNTTHATSHPEKKIVEKNNSICCNLCRSVNSGIWTLCLNCLKSFVQKVEAEFCCKLCDKMYIMEGIAFNHVDKIHFSNLITESNNISNTKSSEQVESHPEINEVRDEIKNSIVSDDEPIKLMNSLLLDPVNRDISSSSSSKKSESKNVTKSVLPDPVNSDITTKVCSSLELEKNSHPEDAEKIVNDCCKLCDKKFENGKNDRFYLRLRHYYNKHFTKQIDIEWDKYSAKGVCPIKDCGFETKSSLTKEKKRNFILHFLSAKHGILDKLITDELEKLINGELQHVNENVKKPNEKVCDILPITNNENFNDENIKSSNSVEKNDSNSSFKNNIVDKNDKTNVDEEKLLEKMFNCDLCGAYFINLRTLISHKKQVHNDAKNEEKIEEKTEATIVLKNIERSDPEVDVDTNKTSIVHSNSEHSKKEKTSKLIRCELCNLCLENNKDFTIHNYQKHFEKELASIWKSEKGCCPINNCEYESKKKIHFVWHYFSKKHGILEKLITDELQRRSIEKEKTFENSDQGLDESDIIDSDVNGATYQVKNKCEFCDQTFLVRRYHLYAYHFKKEIDLEIDSAFSAKTPNSNSILEIFPKCPIRDCKYFSTSKGNLRNHYIGETHDILAKFIEKKRKEVIQSDDETQEDIRSKMQDLQNSKILTEEKNSNGHSPDLKEDKPENSSQNESLDAGENPKKGDADCKLCGKIYQKSDHPNKFTYHNFSKHFPKELNEIWELHRGRCPISNCEFKAKLKNNFIFHYFGKKHDVLEKLIKSELHRKQQEKSSESKELEQKVNSKSDHTRKITPLKVKILKKSDKVVKDLSSDNINTSPMSVATEIQPSNSSVSQQSQNDISANVKQEKDTNPFSVNGVKLSQPINVIFGQKFLRCKQCPSHLFTEQRHLQEHLNKNHENLSRSDKIQLIDLEEKIKDHLAVKKENKKPTDYSLDLTEKISKNSTSIDLTKNISKNASINLKEKLISKVKDQIVVKTDVLQSFLMNHTDLVRSQLCKHCGKHISKSCFDPKIILPEIKELSKLTSGSANVEMVKNNTKKANDNNTSTENIERTDGNYFSSECTNTNEIITKNSNSNVDGANKIEIISTNIIKCDLCDQTFDIHAKKDEFRNHSYQNHFEKEINEVWKSGRGRCPINECNFRAKVKKDFINHYFGENHEILQNLIKNELLRRESENVDVNQLPFQSEPKFRPSVESEILNAEDDKPPEKCLLCGLSFSNFKTIDIRSHFQKCYENLGQRINSEQFYHSTLDKTSDKLKNSDNNIQESQNMSKSNQPINNSDTSSKSAVMTEPKRRGRKRTWTDENLSKAIENVQNGNMSLSKATKFYGVNYYMLKKIIKSKHVKKETLTTILPNEKIRENTQTSQLSIKTEENAVSSNEESLIFGQLISDDEEMTRTQNPEYLKSFKPSTSTPFKPSTRKNSSSSSRDKNNIFEISNRIEKNQKVDGQTKSRDDPVKKSLDIKETTAMEIDNITNEEILEDEDECLVISAKITAQNICKQTAEINDTKLIPSIMEEVSSNVSISSEPLVNLTPAVYRENLNNMEIEDENFHNFTQSNLVPDPTMVSRIYVCPLCESKAAGKTQVENHLVNFHRMSLEVMNKKGIEIESVLMFLP